jgi:hypothetical protein
MEVSVPKRKCGLDKFMCPGSDSPDICPGFKQKCPKNRIIQTEIETSIFRIKITGQRNDLDGEPRQ